MLASEAQLVAEMASEIQCALLDANHVPAEDRYAWVMLHLQGWLCRRLQKPDMAQAVHNCHNRLQARGREFAGNFPMCPNGEDQS